MDKLKMILKDNTFIRHTFFIVFNAILLYILYFLIKNIGSITGGLHHGFLVLMDAFKPLLIGLVLAYLLNPLVSFVDGKLRVILYAGKGVEARVDDVALTHLDGTTVFERGESAYLRMMKNWVRLYQGAGRDFLAYGFREKPPRLTCARFTMADRTFPAVVRAAYRAADGRRALAVANATDKPQTFSCTWRGRSIVRTLRPTEIALIAD